MKRFAWILLGVVFVVLFVNRWMSFNTNRSLSPQSIKVGIIIPMSGSAAVYGDSARIATKVFQQQNPSISFKFIFEDNENFDIQKTITAAQKLINIDGIDVLITFLTAPGLAVNGIAENAKVPHFGIATDVHVADGKYNFTIATSPKKEAQSRFDWVKKNNYKKIVYILENSAGIKSYYDEFVRLVNQDKDVNLVKTFFIPTKEFQFRNEIIKMKKLEDEVDAFLVDFTTMPMLDNFLRQAKEYDLKLPYTGCMSYLKDKNLAEDVIFPDVANAQTDFLKLYTQEAGNDLTNYSEYIYSVLEIIQKASTDSSNKEEFLNRIYQVVPMLHTAVGKVSIDSNGYLDADSSWKKIENGQIILAE